MMIFLMHVNSIVHELVHFVGANIAYMVAGRRKWWQNVVVNVTDIIARVRTRVERRVDHIIVNIGGQ